MAASFPTLTKLVADPRTGWLLRRIGLIDLLLQTVAHGADLPATLASEAQIFATVWSGPVQPQVTREGIPPDEREFALVELARGLSTVAQGPVRPAEHSRRCDPTACSSPGPPRKHGRRATDSPPTFSPTTPRPAC